MALSSRFASLLLSLALLPLALLRAQDAPPADAGAAKEPRERALAKVRQQLELKPTHPQLFEYYFKQLVENNAVESEVQALTAKLAQEPGQATTSTMLGRLYLRTGKETQALEVLDAIKDKTAELQGVLGDIYGKLGRQDQAARAFTAALPAAVTSEGKSRLYEKIGKSQLALGQKEQAIATWRQIGDLDEGKFHRRMRVAELLTEARLLAEAAAAYGPLLEESAPDPALHCRVLREHGRLQELQGDLDGALLTYETIFARTARGNWLRKDVEGRVVQIYRRQGKLDALVARLETQRQEQPDDLAITELLADVYLETKKREPALAVLRDAGQRFPKDVRLARKLAQLYVDHGATEQAITEYQRILTHKPDELDLYLELGQLFAKGSQFDEAKLQWEKALARHLTDASLCTRIAAMYASYEREDDAVRLYERAIELEPDAMPRYTDLADYLFARGKAEPGMAVLERAFVAAQGKPRRLDALVGPLRERGMFARAQQALETVLQAEPDNQETRYALADLWIEQKEPERAGPLLWQILDADQGVGEGQRTRAANTLVQLAARADTLPALEAEAAGRATAGAAFLLGRVHSRNRDFDKAVASYQAVLAQKPGDVESRRMLARLLADLGDYQGALAAYETVAQLNPSEGKRQFREVARLYLETYEFDKAVEVWQKAMRDNPDNAAVFVEVGREFMAMLRVPEALDAFRQAARLKAADPDIQLRLADALRQAGLPDDAERTLRDLAGTTTDARDREQARTRLFDLYAEQGLIDQRIAALADTVAESPYDQDAPQLLADLYLRTGDLVLGLEMVERALQFQQKNAELLARRVEILEALEEWDKARLAHEELLKLPGTERDVHLAGIGQALYECGRAAEAKAVFDKIQDRGRVVAFFTKYELRDEAIAFYQRAVARFPGDLRNHAALAEQLMERNRNDEAIAVLERALQVNASHRRTLELLGKLYVQVGRRPDAVQCGLRLFGMRGEETERTRQEDYALEKSARERGGRGYSGYTAAFSGQRLSAAQAFFTERGLQEEWGRVLVAEAKRRPADESLFSAVRSHYGWQDKSPQKLAAFVRELLARDWAQVRIPPGQTQRAYRAMLEGTLLGVYGEDNATAEVRLTELAGAADAAALVERAWLRGKLGQAAAAEADLRQALAAEPEHVLAMALLAETLLEAKKHAEAAQWIERVAAWWLTPAGQDAQRELDQRLALEFLRARKAAYDRFPRKLRRQVTDAMLLATRQETRPPGTWAKPGTLSFPEAAPPRLAALHKLIRTQRAAGDEAKVSAAVALATTESTTLAQQAALGALLFEEQRKAEALPLLEAVLGREEATKRDPLLAYAWPSYAGIFDNAARCLGLIYAEQGKALAGYKLLRDHAQAQQAELVLRKQAKPEEVRALLQTGVQTAEAALQAQRARGAGDLTAAELDYRDEVIKLADFLLGEKEFAAADMLYQGSLALLPDDVEIRQVLAMLRLRQGQTEQALATHEDILAVKRRKKRAQQIDAVLPPARLQPSLPDGGRGSSGPSMSSSGPVFRSSMRSGPANLEVTDTYQQILAIHSQRNDSKGILATLQRIQREDPATFRNMSYNVVQQIRNLDLGKDKLPILRALRTAVQNDSWLLLEYGRTCLEAGDLQEAKRSLEKLLATATADNEYYSEQAEHMLTTVAQRTGEAKLSLDDMQQRVQKEPDNMRHRMQLVAKLLTDRRYDEALQHAEVVVQKAPHMAKAKESLINAACAAGQDDRAREMLQKLFAETAKANEKVQRGVAYANWLYAEGKRDQAYAVVDALEVQAGGSSNDQFSAGNWYLDRHQLGRATGKLAAELEKAKGQSYLADRIRPRLARTELASGQVEAAVARHLAAIKAAPSLGDREQRFKDMLGALTGSHAPQAFAAALGKHAARQTVEDLLVTTALAFATGDIAGATADIEKALDLSSKEVYLFPLLYGLKKLRGDYEGALAVLDRMATTYGGSETMRWTSSNTSMSERDQIKVERAALLDDLGRQPEADALVESLHDATKPPTMLTVASALKGRKRFAPALEWRRRYFDQAGPRDADALCDDAELQLELKQLDAALAALNEARLMAKEHERARTLTEQVHRTRGTLPELLASLEQDFAKDPRSAPLRQQLLKLYDELRLHDKRKATYTAMLDDPATKAEALEALIEAAARDNDTARQIALLEQLLALQGGERKKAIETRLAQACRDAGQLEAAEQHKRASVDLDSAQGQLELAGWLRAQDMDAKSDAAVAQALAIDPDGEQGLWASIEQARRSKDWGEYLRRLFFGMDRRGATAIAYGGVAAQPLTVLDALLSLPSVQQDRWLAAGDDPAQAERAGFLHWLLGHDAQARALLEGVVAAAPRRPLALATLRQIAEFEGQPEQALELTQKLHDLVEREHVSRADWEARNAARNLWNELARWQLALGDAAAAEATWRTPPLRRSPVSSGSSSYRYDWEVPYATEQWLAQGDGPRALAALDAEFLMRESAPWDTYWRALVEAGRRPEAEQSAWQRFLDPLRLYGVREQSPSWTWDDISGSSQLSDVSINFLVQSHSRRNALDELLAKSKELAAKPETRLQAEELRRAAVAAGTDWRARAELVEEQFQTSDDNPGARLSAAMFRARAKDTEQALAHLGCVFDLQSPALRTPARTFNPNRMHTYETRGNRPTLVGGQKNPFSFSFQSSSSHSSWYGGSSDDVTHRRSVAVLVLTLAGQPDKAREVELDLIDQAPSKERRTQACQQLAQQFEQAELFADAVRLYQRARAERTSEEREADTWSGENLLRLAKRAGDGELHRALLAEQRTQLEQAVAKASDRKAFPERVQLATFLVRHRVDPAAGLALFEQVASEVGTARYFEAERALALRLTGRAAEAVAWHDRNEQRGRALRPKGYKPAKPVERIEFGLALAAAGDAARARAILDPALVELRQTPRTAPRYYYDGYYAAPYDAELVAEVEAALGKLGQ